MDNTLNPILCCMSDPYSNVIVSDRSGSVRFVDIIDGVTMREEFEETTGMARALSLNSAIAP